MDGRLEVWTDSRLNRLTDHLPFIMILQKYLVFFFIHTFWKVLNYFLGFFLLSLLSIRTTRPFIQICRIYHIIGYISYSCYFVGKFSDGKFSEGKLSRDLPPKVSVCQNANVSNCQRLTVGSPFDWLFEKKVSHIINA